jgi:hypothetical protein
LPLHSSARLLPLFQTRFGGEGRGEEDRNENGHPSGRMTKFFRRAKSSAKASASSSLPSTGRECAETNFAH